VGISKSRDFGRGGGSHLSLTAFRGGTVDTKKEVFPRLFFRGKEEEMQPALKPVEGKVLYFRQQFWGGGGGGEGMAFFPLADKRERREILF